MQDSGMKNTKTQMKALYDVTVQDRSFHATEQLVPAPSKE
jgi:hypothetical protein